jgi:hypothetical protein
MEMKRKEMEWIIVGHAHLFKNSDLPNRLLYMSVVIKCFDLIRKPEGAGIDYDIT